MVRSFICQSVFPLTFLRYMKDFFAANRQHTLSLSYLSIREMERNLNQGGNFGAILTKLSKAVSYLSSCIWIIHLKTFKTSTPVLNKNED